MIDPRALRTYLAVCRAGSISAAARVLCLSQPSVSVAIAQLEHQLGAVLFERKRSGVVRTPAGEALLRQAEAMDGLLREAHREVALARDGIHGPLRVGGTPGALVSLLPEALSRLERADVKLAARVVERPDSSLVDLLRRREIELAFVTTGLETPPADITERGCVRDPFDLVVGRAHDHLPEVVALREVSHLPWVLPDAVGAFRRQVDALFMAADVPVPPDVIRCDSLLTTKALVRAGRHVTVLPRRVAAAELSIGVLRAVRLTDVAMERTVGVRYLRDVALSEGARLLLAELPSLDPIHSPV